MTRSRAAARISACMSLSCFPSIIARLRHIFRLRRNKPPSLFQPDIRFLSLDAAGEPVPYAARRLAGCPADVRDLIDKILVLLVELHHQRADFSVFINAQHHRHVFSDSFLFHTLTPQSIRPGGWCAARDRHTQVAGQAARLPAGCSNSRSGVAGRPSRRRYVPIVHA